MLWLEQEEKIKSQLNQQNSQMPHGLLILQYEDNGGRQIMLMCVAIH
jgi:hypothetical protein